MKIEYRGIAMGPAKAELIRTANAVIGEYIDAGYRLTLRQLYYQFGGTRSLS